MDEPTKQILVPWDKAVELLADDGQPHAAADKLLKSHAELCPARLGFPAVEEHVGKVEVRLAALLGYMFGSGILGGGAFFGLLKLLGAV